MNLNTTVICTVLQAATQSQNSPLFQLEYCFLMQLEDQSVYRQFKYGTGLHILLLQLVKV